MYVAILTRRAIRIPVGDGFRDVLVCLEKSETHPNSFIPPDGDGWLLECGIPCHCILLIIMIQNNISLK